MVWILMVLLMDWYFDGFMDCLDSLMDWVGP